MSNGCKYEGCTVAETGRCALERKPEACPNRITASESDADVDAGAPVLSAPRDNPSFPRSNTLSPDAIEQMMRRRYLTVVGILGDPESGKTACLASLYLLISNAMLDGWSFSDSRSLMAFEEISRGARQWNEGQPPDQMTVHTEMSDDRQPGFLHLRLRQTVSGRIVDLALPDLPGEWTKTLIRSARADRFAFLSSADVIWLVVDGGTLADREQRQGTIVRLGVLADRLRVLFEDKLPRILMLITHRDKHEPTPAVVDRVSAEFAKYGVSIEIAHVASFSKNKKIKAGYGLAQLITATAGKVKSAPVFWPLTSPASSARSFLSYRRDHE